MTEKNIEWMLDKNRILLTPGRFIEHFLPVVALTVLPLFGIIVRWDREPIGIDDLSNYFGFILVYSSILLVMFVLQINQLRLKKLTVEMGEEDILATIKMTGELFHWRIRTISRQFIQADSRRIFGTWCRITIIIRGHDVYLNCLTLFGGIGPFRREKIVDTFERNLRMREHEVKFQEGRMKQASR